MNRKTQRMKPIFTLLLLVAVAALNAQTRRIAHRFHSGSDHAVYTSGDGSYGGPYIPMKYVTKSDTIIFFNGKDSVSRVVDTTYYELDTTQLHKNHLHGGVNDVREYGKICSSYTGK